MNELASHIDQAIQNLGVIERKMDRPPRGFIATQRALNRQKLALDKASIDNASSQYATAIVAMKSAADKSRTAVDDLVMLEDALSEMSKAIALVEKLLVLVA